jgi:hypothetical protein
MKNFSEGISLEEANVLIGQIGRANIGKKAGRVVLPHFFNLMGNCRDGLYSVG